MSSVTVEPIPDVAPVSVKFQEDDGSIHRETRNPGADLSDLPENVRQQIETHWTPTLVASWEASIQPVPPTADEMRASVNAERDRRIIAGKTINGIAVTGRDEDARNLTHLALAAQLRIGSGDTTTTTTFRDGNNVDHDLTPPEMLALWQGSAAYVSALYEASWALKAMDPIPADYADDTYWPAV